MEENTICNIYNLSKVELNMNRLYLPYTTRHLSRRIIVTMHRNRLSFGTAQKNYWKGGPLGSLLYLTMSFSWHREGLSIDLCHWDSHDSC